MRTEQEMFDLILSFANADDNIRVVLLNGSRANPNASKDPFQDFDIACIVRDVTPYWNNPQIPPAFGEMMILQTPEDMGDPAPDSDGHYTYLMQFMDGNRIDLSFYPLEKMAQVLEDSLTLVLMDKDGCLPQLPPASEDSYLPKPPTAKQFADCCNEFWWLTPYVAKALWRGEIPHAKHLLDCYMRGQMLKMLTWYFGIRTGFTTAPGKQGKNIKNFIEPRLWLDYMQTYPDAQTQHIWDALLCMGKLFHELGQDVTQHFGYPYPLQEDKNVSSFIRHIRTLPSDAKKIY
ncbi:MAG: aminoglycoside adenylyltransferase [Chloroflexi bacterium HGW-Chloroflexi-10]|nr:MAG: aminoglycoside adenylyltransferase [Chloroflexi bacterium HGW-Chloroflexi-10]